MGSYFDLWPESAQRALENWELNLAISKNHSDFSNEVWTWESLVCELRKGFDVTQSSSAGEQKPSSSSGFDNPLGRRAWYPGPGTMTDEGWSPIGQSVLVLDFDCSRPAGLCSFLRDKSSFGGVAWCLYPVIDAVTAKTVMRLISPFAETVSTEVNRAGFAGG